MENSFYYIISFFIFLYYLWDKNKKEKAALIARNKIKKDKKLYNYMKQGLKEYMWIKKDVYMKEVYFSAKDKELLFENIDVKIYKVKHFAETRLGFFIKETNEYGLYREFDGYPSYCRSDKSFTEDKVLYYNPHDDEDYDDDDES